MSATTRIDLLSLSLLGGCFLAPLGRCGEAQIWRLIFAEVGSSNLSGLDVAGKASALISANRAALLVSDGYCLAGRGGAFLQIAQVKPLGLKIVCAEQVARIGEFLQAEQVNYLVNDLRGS